MNGGYPEFFELVVFVFHYERKIVKTNLERERERVYYSVIGWMEGNDKVSFDRMVS